MGEMSKESCLSEVPSKRAIKNKELFDISKVLLHYYVVNAHVAPVNFRIFSNIKSISSVKGWKWMRLCLTKFMVHVYSYKHSVPVSMNFLGARALAII